MPLDRGLGAVDLDPEVVLATVRDLRGGHRAEGAVLVADGGAAVVIELAAGLEGLQQTGNPVRQKAGDESAEVIGVRADVAVAARGTGGFRIGAPARLFLVLRSPPASA